MQEICAERGLNIGDKFAQNWRGLGGNSRWLRMNWRRRRCGGGRLGDGSGQETIAKRGFEVGDELSQDAGSGWHRPWLGSVHNSRRDLHRGRWLRRGRGNNGQFFYNWLGFDRRGLCNGDRSFLDDFRRGNILDIEFFDGRLFGGSFFGSSRCLCGGFDFGADFGKACLVRR